MKKQILVIVSIVLLGLILGACSQPASDENQSMAANQQPGLISVIGQGKVFLTPDIAYITIGVRTESENVTESLSANNQQSQDVYNALVNWDVTNQDIQTTSLNIYPYQEYNQVGEVQGTKYVVENAVYVTIRDLANLGEILDTVIRAGANSINSIQFDVEDKEGALSEARSLAVKDAKTQAEALAEAAEVELGDLMNLNTYGSNNPVPLYNAGKGGGLAMMDAAETMG